MKPFSKNTIIQTLPTANTKFSYKKFFLMVIMMIEIFENYLIHVPQGIFYFLFIQNEEGKMWKEISKNKKMFHLSFWEKSINAKNYYLSFKAIFPPFCLSFSLI